MHAGPVKVCLIPDKDLGLRQGLRVTEDCPAGKLLVAEKAIAEWRSAEKDGSNTSAEQEESSCVRLAAKVVELAELDLNLQAKVDRQDPGPDWKPLPGMTHREIYRWRLFHTVLNNYYGSHMDHATG